ncbi:MAG: FecR domain-containing protein [Sphingomonas sp.]|uniref:FecR family protein n=1 Tax=Sphingomonas sp. TaxID=28214 RepID=UPI0025F8C371|nr:FecR domain-containing protein [Sphingomonas sp.]MBX3565579.1 FecR domain-containing protein [Sphingomonas sp.]
MSRASEARDRAAQWIVAREEAGWSDADQAGLDAWLAEADMNRVAFLRLEHSWREADRIRSIGPVMMPATLRQDRDEPSRYRGRPRWLPLAVAASLVCAIGIGWSVSPWSTNGNAVRTASTRYDTDIGGHRIVALSDGSRVELNTASVVRTAFRDAEREVWLDRGEAYFEVAHDRNRPFVVHAGNRQVTVLGTKFSVRRDGDKVTVFVREGRVRVDDVEGARALRSTTITAGDIALARGPATLVTAKSEERVEDALAWRGGMLSFEQERLSDIAAEFNRYNRQKLIVADQAAGGIRIGGMFPASKPGDFVRLLRDAYGLRIEETPEAIRISS